MAGADAAGKAAIAAWIAQQHGELERQSYYALLQVPRDASDATIRDAYYRLAARLHPDLFQDALEPETRRKLVALYSRIVEGYRTLSDHAKRANYDRGLAGGKLRYTVEDDTRARAPRDVAADIENPSARRFFDMGRKAMAAGDAKGAVMHLRFALSAAPGVTIIAEELARAEAAAKPK